MFDVEKTMCAKRSAIERIFSQQTEEGYWISHRITDPKSSNVDRTAFVLEDLSNAIELYDDPRVSRGITHLINNQNSDGGWSDLKGEPSRPTVTSYVLWALGKFRVRSSMEVERGVRWLEQAQCKDGGWTEIVERAWERGIAPGEAQSWITGSCIRGLKNCPQTRKEVIQSALVFLGKAQEADGSWEGRMGTGIVLQAFKEVGLTIEREMVRRGVDYELNFQRADGFLPDAWHGSTLMHMIRSLDTFLKLGVSPEDERITRMLTYLRARKKVLTQQFDKRANITIFKILEDFDGKPGVSLLR